MLDKEKSAFHLACVYRCCFPFWLVLEVMIHLYLPRTCQKVTHTKTERTEGRKDIGGAACSLDRWVPVDFVTSKCVVLKGVRRCVTCPGHCGEGSAVS